MVSTPMFDDGNIRGLPMCCRSMRLVDLRRNVVAPSLSFGLLGVFLRSGLFNAAVAAAAFLPTSSIVASVGGLTGDLRPLTRSRMC